MSKLLKKKAKIKYLLFTVLGLISGVVIGGVVGVTATTNKLEAKYVMYTKDGVTMTVQDAIKDLYTKSSKGSNQTLQLGEVTVAGTQITIPYTGSYATVRCLYGTNENYGSVGTISGNTCTFSGSANTTYYYKLIATNNAGKIYENSGNKTTNSESVKPNDMTLSSNSDSTYTKTKSITVTLKDTGGSGLAAGTIKYGWSTSASTEPSSYTTVNTSATTGENTTTFPASGSNLNGSYYLWVVPVTYKDTAGNSNTTTVKSTGTYKFDNTAPSNMTLSSNSDSTATETKSITVTLKDTSGSGLVAGSIQYGWSKSRSTAPSSYTTVSTSATTGTNTTTFKANGSNLAGSYYLWVVPVTYKDKAGNSNGTTVKSTGTYKFKKSISAVNLGDYIYMQPTKTSYSITSSMTGCVSGIGSYKCNGINGASQTINPSELTVWRVIRKNSNGTVDVVSENVSSTDVYFYGQTGYQKFIGTLNTIAAQYTSNYVQSTRHMGYSNQTQNITNTSLTQTTTVPWTSKTSSSTTSADEALGAGDMGYETDYNLVQTALRTLVANNPLGTATNYWLASRYYYYGYSISPYWNFYGRDINTSGSLNRDDSLISCMTDNDECGSYSEGYAVRPILTLKSTVKIIGGSGTSNDNYKLG